MPWRSTGEWRHRSTHSLTSALDGCEWSDSGPGRFTPRERAPDTHWIGGWVCLRAVLDAVVKRKNPSTRQETNPRNPIVQPVAQRYTDWAITALLHFAQIPNILLSNFSQMLSIHVYLRALGWNNKLHIHRKQVFIRIVPFTLLWNIKVSTFTDQVTYTFKLAHFTEKFLKYEINYNLPVVLYGWNTCTLTLREEHTLRVLWWWA
jgi:hypothetical protein